MMRLNTLGAIGILCLSMGASRASMAEGVAFETVKGWDIERYAGETGPNCYMVKSLADRDSNAEKGVVFSQYGGKAVVALVSDGWNWGKDQRVLAPFALDGQMVSDTTSWEAQEQDLATKLPESFVPNLLAANAMAVKLGTGDVVFELTGFPEAYASLRRCDVAHDKAKTAPNM